MSPQRLWWMRQLWWRRSNSTNITTVTMEFLCRTKGLEIETRLILSKVTQPAKFIFMFIFKTSHVQFVLESILSARLIHASTCLLSRVCGCLFLLPNYPFFGLYAGWVGKLLQRGAWVYNAVNHCDSFLAHTRALS